MSQSLSIKSSRRIEMIDITEKVRGCVHQSAVTEGLCMVFIPHTTAGITINENADPSVCSDIAKHLSEIIPAKAGFTHAEGNSDAHIKASLVGFSQTLLIENGDLVLGTWQGIYFCEFDGPRNRTYYVKIMRA